MDRSDSTGNDTSRLHHPLSSRLGIDARALAAFRIGLGAILVLDLLLRARNLRTFYTNDGVLPVSVLAERTPTYARLSLHALSGGTWLQLLLFAVAIVSGVALAVGYHTRIATGASFALLLSLHARNPYVLAGGDALLQHLTFWSLLLPLGSRWSVDASRRGRSRERVVSVASAAVLIQVLLVYGVNALLKFRGDLWLSGDAVAVILGLDRFTALLGPLLLELPFALEAANWAWLGLLAASPLLVLSTGRTRITLVGAFATMHSGMLLTMDLGIFPLVSILALIPFLPSPVWSRLERGGAANRLRSALSPRLTRLRERSPDGETGAPRGRWPDRLARPIAAVALAGIVLFNATALGFVPVPPPADDTLSGEYADARWTMFAPHPPTTDRGYVAAGRLASGDRVTLFRRAGVRRTRPTGIGSAFPAARFRKYLSHLRRDRALRPPFAAYLCDRWDGDRSDELVAVSVYTVETSGHAPTDGTRERTELVDASCEAQRRTPPSGP